MHTQPPCSNTPVATPSELITALRDLYIVSSAAAQLGGYGLEVHEAQWRALARGTRGAKAVLDQQTAARDTDAITAFRQLAKMCEDILELYARHQKFPSAVWREVGRLGREAYDCIDLCITRQRGGGA
ncbi:hypothetical protein AB4Y45_40795 [Paraburkholderia sp. EG287A]|uniref:hypothetical protein n=1 Tax=unclassified Paraburkholderia TaxID=2615204 RepID=UPI0034D34152